MVIQYEGKGLHRCNNEHTMLRYCYSNYSKTEITEIQRQNVT